MQYANRNCSREVDIFGSRREATTHLNQIERNEGVSGGSARRSGVQTTNRKTYREQVWPEAVENSFAGGRLQEFEYLGAWKFVGHRPLHTTQEVREINQRSQKIQALRRIAAVAVEGVGTGA